MTGRKPYDEILRLIDGSSGQAEAPVQRTAGPLFPTPPVAKARFDPSLRTAAEQMAERLGREGVGRGA